ncbi:MAG: ATP synthase F1 subunit gamma [Planctomycetales bacterium]|nr:ATP synthase F1 subunit gamma [Planctomycetales bacterium]
MAKARELRRRIKSVRNTRKITRTMELVATAKAKVTTDRVKSVVPYSQTLLGMVSALVASGARHPLLGSDAPVKKVVLFGITANRGLCGGYNSNVLRMLREALEQERAAGREVALHLAGKKGLSAMRFLRIPVAEGYTQFADKPRFEEVEAVARPLVAAFARGDVQRVDLVSCRYLSSSEQKPRRKTLLPITPPPAPKGIRVEPILHPAPAALLGELLPLVAATSLFEAFVEAAASEQVARRIAMKLATDNADEMIGDLTRTYNRARQAQITQEIAEVMGGALALS